MELVAVPVGGEEDRRPVRRPGDLPHRLVGEDGQLVGVAAGAGLAPEVELAGGVGDVSDLAAVGREREGWLVPPDGGELLEGVPAGGRRDGRGHNPSSSRSAAKRRPPRRRAARIPHRSETLGMGGAYRGGATLPTRRTGEPTADAAAVRTPPSGGARLAARSGQTAAVPAGRFGATKHRCTHVHGCRHDPWGDVIEQRQTAASAEPPSPSRSVHRSTTTARSLCPEPPPVPTRGAWSRPTAVSPALPPHPTWTAGRRDGSGSARRSTSWVTGAMSPSPKSTKRTRYLSGFPSAQPK
jgi:hypothetical protein